MAQKLNVNTSIVDYLKSVDKDASFKSRTQLAVKLDVVKKASDYTGSAQQNTALLKAAKSEYGKKDTKPDKKDTKADKKDTDKKDTKPTKADTGKKDTKPDKKDTKPDKKDTKPDKKDTKPDKKDTKPSNPVKPATNTTAQTTVTTSDGGKIADKIKTDVTTGVNSTATQVMDNITQLLAAALPEGGDYSYKEFKTMAATDPALKTAQDLAKLYGLDYSLENIYNTLMKSTDAGYAARYNQQAQAEDKYYDNAATAQSTLTDTLRKQQSQAILSGANKGMQAANALSAMLGTSQQFAANATQLAKDREQIGKEYAADQAQTGVTALNTYNAMGNQLADISKNIYSSDTSKYVGQLDYNSSINTANAQMASQSMAAKTQWESTYASSIASAYQAYYNGQITLEQARVQADAAIKSAKEYGLDAAKVTSKANEQIALTNKDATVDAATIGANATTSAAQIGANATTSAAQIGANATTQAAATSANATVDAANASAKGYVDSQNAANANNAKTSGANLVTGIISGFNTGAISSADALTALNGYLAAGLIDQSTYNSTKSVVNKKTTTTTDPAVTTPATSKKDTSTTTKSGVTLYSDDPLASGSAGKGYKY